MKKNISLIIAILFLQVIEVIPAETKIWPTETWIPATSGFITNGFSTNGGYLVSTSTYSMSGTNRAAGQGVAVYYISNSVAGDYTLKATSIATNDVQNSFYVGLDINPGEPMSVWDVPIGSILKTNLVSLRGGGTTTSNQFNPMVWTLSEGVHVLTVLGREFYTKVQKWNLQPVIPTNESPNISFLLAWQVPAPPTNVDHYEIWYKTNLMGTFRFLSGAIKTNSISLTYAKTNMPNQGYYIGYAHQYFTTNKTNWRAILAWDPSPGTNVITNYSVYYGVASTNYTNKILAKTNLTATVSNLAPNKVYYFAATAVDNRGLESDFSNEVNTQSVISYSNTNAVRMGLRIQLIQ